MLDDLIKPLEWHNYDAWTWWAETVCGTYAVEERNGIWKAELRFRDAVHIVYEIDDFETSITAAQDDYCARIRAAMGSPRRCCARDDLTLTDAVFATGAGGKLKLKGGWRG